MSEFKSSDMHDVGKKPEEPMAVKERSKIYYPSIQLTTKQLNALNKFGLDDNVTIHAHGKITGTFQRNKEPKEVDIDIMKVGIKPGHNPYSNLPKSLWGKMEDCVVDVKSKGGADNPYAVCYASLKGKYKKILKKFK